MKVMKKQLMYRVVCIVLSVVCFIVSISSLGVLAKSSSEVDGVDQELDVIERYNCCNLEVGEYISLETEQRHFVSSEDIGISYLFSSDEGITDYEYTQRGFSSIEVLVDDENSKRVIVELSCVPNAEEYIGKFM